jgi:hypothetical protein
MQVEFLFKLPLCFSLSHRVNGKRMLGCHAGLKYILAYPRVWYLSNYDENRTEITIYPLFCRLPNSLPMINQSVIDCVLYFRYKLEDNYA